MESSNTYRLIENLHFAGYLYNTYMKIPIYIIELVRKQPTAIEFLSIEISFNYSVQVRHGVRMVLMLLFDFIINGNKIQRYSTIANNNKP